MRMLRLVLWLAVAVALFVLGAISVGFFGARDSASLQVASSEKTPAAPLGGAFSLIDQHGQKITEAVFRGKPSATLFGFTHCPDVCPTGLMEMSSWARALGADADKVRFVFVTVDPERDTPEAMNEYVSAFSDRIIGVTGEPEAVRAMLRDYKIAFRKVPLEGGDYTMDHLASMILHDAEGNFAGTIASEEDRETAMAKIRNLVAG